MGLNVGRLQAIVDVNFEVSMNCVLL